MAWVDENINTYVRDLIRPVLHSTYVSVRPLLAILAGRDKANLDRLGDPDAGAFWGGNNIGIGERNMLSGSLTHKFRYQKSQTDAAAVVTEGAATPTSTVFSEDNVGTAGVNWTHFWNPLKIREDSILNAQNVSGKNGEMGRLQIASIIEEAIGMGFQRALEKQQSNLWTSELSAGQQSFSAQTWPGYIGVQQWCDDGGVTSGAATVGGVDRTVETELKGNAKSVGSTDFGDGAGEVNIRGIRQVRLFDMYGSVRKKYASAGNLIVTTPEIWEGISNAADLRNQVNSSDIREFAISGFKNPLVKIDDALVAWDHDCPDGEMYFLTPEFWTFEIQSGANFAVEPWQRKWLVDEGGEYYRFTNIHTKSRLVCRRPDLQVKLTDVVALNS